MIGQVETAHGAPISKNFHCARLAAPCDLRSRPGACPEEGDE